MDAHVSNTGTVPTHDELRKARGLVIAKRARIESRKPGVWLVPSQKNPWHYVVEATDSGPVCNCPDFEERQERCKHMWAVEFSRCSETMADGSTKTVETLKVTYAQDWPRYNLAQCREKEYAAKLLRGLCDAIKEPPPRRGHPSLPVSDRVFAATMKVFTTLSTRRNDTDMREWQAKGYLSKAPHYNSVINYLNDPALTPILTAMITDSAQPLRLVESDFAADASGFTTVTYRRWYDEKYGREKSEQQWLKAHIMCGVKTNVVTHAIVTDGTVHDSPMFPALVEETAKRFDVREISADKGYLAHDNYRAVEKIGATPFIMFKENTIGAGSDLWERMFSLYRYKRPEYLARYHKRSNVETTFSMIKKKFGGNLRSKKEIAQKNELLAKILCHNLSCLVHSMFELDVIPEFWPESV